MLAQLLVPWGEAFNTATNPSPPPPLFIDVWLLYWQPVILFLVQVASLIFLIIYVVKTANIATANRQAAQATEDTAKSTLSSVELSKKVLDEMQEARDAQTAPYVVVYLDLTNTFLIEIVMENLGQMMAENISLEFKPPLEQGIHTLHWLPIFSTSVTPNLAPRQQMRGAIHGAFLLKNSKVPTKYEATVKYSGGMTSKERIGTYILDLESTAARTVDRETNLEARIREGLQQLDITLEKTLNQISSMGWDIDIGLSTSAAIIAQLDGTRRVDPVLEFKNAAKGLTASWQVLQSIKDVDGYFFRRQKQFLSMQVVSILSFNLMLSDQELERLHSLIFRLMLRLQPSGDQIPEEKVGSIASILGELEDFASKLAAAPI